MATLGVAMADLFRSTSLASPSPDSFPVGNGARNFSSTAAGLGVDNAKFPLFSMSAMWQHQLNAKIAAAQKMSRCECHDLFEELVPYVTAWKWQKETLDSMCAALTKGEEPSNSVILLQHPPVYTMGTRSSDCYLRFDKENPPFELHRTERGGEVTYHGPGQLVMYPILNLRNHKMDLHWYLHMLEEVVIRTLSSACGLEASRIDGYTGVWVEKESVKGCLTISSSTATGKWHSSEVPSTSEVIFTTLKKSSVDFSYSFSGEVKVAAIGVRVSRWITYHGLALNVTTDLAPFQNIVPCGIADRPVGSIRQILKTERNEGQKNCPPTRNQIFGSIPRGIENGSYRTGITSEISKATEKTDWDDVMLLRHVHDSLLREFAELFQLQLVPPTREGPKT